MSDKRRVVITIEWDYLPKKDREEPKADQRSASERTQSTLDEVGIPKTPPMHQEGEYIAPAVARDPSIATSGQLGMRKVRYNEGRKVHTCSRCQAPNRHCNHAKGGCVECRNTGRFA